jgi:hypothetical protein
LQLSDGDFHQGHMGPMRRVERAAKNAQTQHCGLGVVRGSRQTQTQSLGTKKWLSKRSSGEPASSFL